MAVKIEEKEMDEKISSDYSFVRDWKFHLIILIACMISDKIGAIVIPVWGSVRVTLLPLLYSMAIVTALYLIKPFKWVGTKNNAAGALMMGLSTILLMAKLGFTVGANLKVIWESSIPLLFSNLADSMTCILALPLALALGLKRESIGLTFANSREAGIAIIENRYGDGAELRGVIGMYITGTVFGTITVGILSSVFTTTGLFSLEAVAMAAGIGSASMSTAAIGTMVSMFPAIEQKISAFVIASNLISSVLAIYVGLFINLPITEWMYKRLSPILGKKAKASTAPAKAEG